MLKSKTTLFLLTGLVVIVCFGIIDSRVTAALNAAERTRFQNVKLGMAEDNVVRLMGRKPFEMIPHSGQAEIVVRDRLTLIDSIRSWGHPSVTKAIVLEGGRVVDIREHIIFR